MSDNHNKRVAEIIQQILYITIATASKDGQPWNTPVYSGFDENLNFYWASDKGSQHSRNVRENSRVFLVIYDSTMAEGTGEGVYIEAEAVELTDKEEMKVARRSTQGRKGKQAEEDPYIQFTGDNIRRIYKATPKKIWMNDDEKDANGNYVRDIRVEVPLDILKSLINS